MAHSRNKSLLLLVFLNSVILISSWKPFSSLSRFYTSLVFSILKPAIVEIRFMTSDDKLMIAKTVHLFENFSLK